MHRDYSEIIQSLENAHITSATDLSQLSDNDMNQLGIPIGLKSKLRTYLYSGQ